MSRSNEEILIDYLDNNLGGEDSKSVEQLLANDTEAANELQHFQFSVELIREAGLRQEVAAVRNELKDDAKVIPLQPQQGTAVVRSMYKNVMRIAVMVVLVLGATVVYKYSVTDSSSVFNKYYSSFDLNTSRGNDNDGEIEKAYRNKDWATVTNMVKSKRENSSKAWFLNGMASMELKDYTSAIFSFNEVISQNKGKKETYFEDESEYYLALSYLANKQATEGVFILKKIRADKNHLFYQKAQAMSSTDLQVLEIKGDK